jgi:hypothetical protein
MKWPWSKPERATLTLLPDDQYVLGTCRDMTDEQIEGILRAIRAWADGGTFKAVILPFPVDVVDMRGAK